MAEEYEGAVRKYETDAYDVATCLIKIGGNAVQGYKFKFVGDRDPGEISPAA